MTTETDSNLSERGWATVEGILPKIKDTVAERSKKVNTNIDLSTAENWLIRPELVNICKDAIDENLSPKVSLPEPKFIFAIVNIDSTAPFVSTWVFRRSRPSAILFEVVQ